MPAMIWPLVSGHRPTTSVCYQGPCLLLQTLEALFGALDALDSKIISRRSKISFSLGHLGYLSKIPAMTSARPV